MLATGCRSKHACRQGEAPTSAPPDKGGRRIPLQQRCLDEGCKLDRLEHVAASQPGACLASPHPTQLVRGLPSATTSGSRCRFAVGGPDADSPTTQEADHGIQRPAQARAQKPTKLLPKLQPSKTLGRSVGQVLTTHPCPVDRGRADEPLSWQAGLRLQGHGQAGAALPCRARSAPTTISAPRRPGVAVTRR